MTLKRSPRVRHSCKRKAAGFTYAVLLALIAILAITAGVAEELASRTNRREREAELMYRGLIYVHAIKSYYQANGQYPRQLQDLIHDPHAAHRRHLRALYPDPMAKGAVKDWQLVPSPDGGIAGVVSASREEPLKKANFPKELKKFEQAKSYGDWVFDYVPRLRDSIPAPPAIPSKALQ